MCVCVCVWQETQRLQLDPVPGISAVPDESNARHFHVEVAGPDKVRYLLTWRVASWNRYSYFDSLFLEKKDNALVIMGEKLTCCLFSRGANGEEFWHSSHWHWAVFEIRIFWIISGMPYLNFFLFFLCVLSLWFLCKSDVVQARVLAFHNNNNNNRIQRHYSRFFTISSQRRELSPTRT